MGSKIVDIRRYQPSGGERFLFDANPWLFICWPNGDYEKEKATYYSGLLRTAMQKKCEIVITATVLSEIVNRVLRAEYGILKAKSPSEFADFKRDFRGSATYKATLKDIALVVERQILCYAKPIDDGFSNVSVVRIVAGMAKGDFNDCCYSWLASLRGLVLVSNDGDFSSVAENVTVVTANWKMVNRARNLGTN